VSKQAASPVGPPWHRPLRGRLDELVIESEALRGNPLRWLACDPVRMVPGHADALRSLRAIYIDAGTRNEWFLELGAVAFGDALTAIGITDAHFEMFNAGHMGIEYGYPIAMRYLAEHMAAPRP
jgi:hypothetical protein